MIKKPWPSMMRTIYKDPERYKTTGIPFPTVTQPAMSAIRTLTAICGSWAVPMM